MFTSRWAKATALILLCGLAWSGCGEDDGTSPGEADLRPTSLSELSDTYSNALDDMDQAAYAALLDTDFAFIPHPGDAYLFPVSSLNRAEDLQSIRNIFSGLPIPNFVGNLMPAVGSITVGVWEPQTDWTQTDADDPDFPSAWSRRYAFQMSIVRPSDTTVIIQGEQVLYVKEDLGSSGKASRYSLVGLRDLSDNSKGSAATTLGQMMLLYMSSSPPEPVCSASVVEGSFGRRFAFDACSSSDPEGRACLFRWRFEPEGSWTSWAEDCQEEYTYSTYGQKSTLFEVRDPWGYAAQGSLQVAVQFVIEEPFPDTPDKVIQNLRAAYQGMSIDIYRHVLHPSFVFHFLQYDIDNLNLPTDHFTRAQDLTSTESMFSGLPVGDVPAVGSINWSVLERQGVWETSSNPEYPDAQRGLFHFAISITRPGATTLIFGGQQEFYVTSRDSMVDGSPTPYWQLLGQVDLSDIFVSRGIEQATWGTVKHLYYDDL
jgi:hypothetical protein